MKSSNDSIKEFFLRSKLKTLRANAYVNLQKIKANNNDNVLTKSEESKLFKYAIFILYKNL